MRAFRPRIIQFKNPWLLLVLLPLVLFAIAAFVVVYVTYKVGSGLISAFIPSGRRPAVPRTPVQGQGAIEAEFHHVP